MLFSYRRSNGGSRRARRVNSGGNANTRQVERPGGNACSRGDCHGGCTCALRDHTGIVARGYLIVASPTKATMAERYVMALDIMVVWLKTGNET